MAQRVFALRRHFGSCHRLSFGNKHRIVSETVISSGFERDAPFDDSDAVKVFAAQIRVRKRQDALKTRRAIFDRNVAKVFQEQLRPVSII